MILILCILQLIFISMVWMMRRRLSTFEKELTQVIWREIELAEKRLLIILQRFDKSDHDLQQIKTRLHWSREREIKNMKLEAAKKYARNELGLKDKAYFISDKDLLNAWTWTPREKTELKNKKVTKKEVK